MREALKFSGIEFSDSPEDLFCYGFDASRLKTTPGIVVWAKGVEDVASVMKIASEKGVPVVPRGAGTATTGASTPVEGGVVLSLEKMQRIIEIDEENMDVLVEPGVINGRLQRGLEVLDLFYPPDPASLEFCTIGGNVALNAGGPRGLKYGVTRDYVLELEAVTPEGTVIRAGARTLKRTVGYDLKDLLIGSEGTLAIITKIRLRVLPMPERRITLLTTFDSISRCGDFILSVLKAGILPSCMELMDRGAVEVVEEYRATGLPVAEASLLIELDGSNRTVIQDAERVAEVCRRCGGEVQVAEDHLSQEALWKARRSIAPALYRLGSEKINHDVVVPRRQIPTLFEFLRKVSGQQDVKVVAFGHAGDGNIHINILYHRELEQSARAVAKRLIEEVLRLEGTISGEHGVGLTKRQYIGLEISNREMDIMRGIKRLFDPKGILNPGKVFP